MNEKEFIDGVYRKVNYLTFIREKEISLYNEKIKQRRKKLFIWFSIGLVVIMSFFINSDISDSIYVISIYLIMFASIYENKLSYKNVQLIKGGEEYYD